MKQAFVILSFFLISLTASAQAFNDTVFQYTYGGIQNDVCNQLKATYDKGYILIGTTNSFCVSGTDMYAVKVDSLGKHQWSKVYGGDLANEGYSVEPTFDHGYAFLGWTNSFGAGGYDVYLVRTDSAGNVVWQKTYGGSDWDFGYCIRQTPDSGFVICGQTYSYGAGNGDVYVIRTDKNGDTLWTRTVGGTGYDFGNSVYVKNDSTYIIAGSTTSYGIGDTNMYLIQINNMGVVEKDTTYSCTHTTVANSIEGTPDGGYEIAGYSDSLSPGRDYMIILKTISSFGYQWEMELNFSSGIGYGKDALQSPDGKTISLGTSNTQGAGGYAMLIIRGNDQYELADPFEGGTQDEEGNSIAYNYANNNVVFAGATDSYGAGLYDFFLLRYSNDSNIKADYICYHDTIKYMDTVPCTTSINEITPVPLMAKVFPNPVTDQATVIVQDEMDGKCNFSLYDLMGQCVIPNIEMKPSGHKQLMVHIAKGSLQTGVYFYKIQSSDNKTATGKIIVE